MKQLLALACASILVACGGGGQGASPSVTVPPTVKAPPTLALLAGNLGGAGHLDGIGAAARFFNPQNVAVDGAGNVYVPDVFYNTIRKITSAGVVSTLAGTAGVSGSADGVGAAARFNQPTGVSIDNGGNLYVADAGNGTIRKITPSGVVTTLVGTAGVYGSADGVGTVARFSCLNGIAIDGAGNLYVAEACNRTIRKITPAGSVSTLAGPAGFYGPQSIAADSAGNVYVADSPLCTCEKTGTIRKITADGGVTTIASTAPNTGNADGASKLANFSGYQGLAVDKDGNLYAPDSDTIRKMTPDGVVSTLAGSRNAAGSADGIGASARFLYPQGLATDAAGYVYIADTYNNTIRKMTPDGAVTTLAGQAVLKGYVDGPATSARFIWAKGVATDSFGNVYVSDVANHAVRKIDPDGVVSTLAKIPYKSTPGTGENAPFSSPDNLVSDANGNVYVADAGTYSILKITPNGVTTTLAGLAGAKGNVDAMGTQARFGVLGGIAIDSKGNLYVADNDNATVRKISPDGMVSTFAGTAGVRGSSDGVGARASFRSLKGVATDSADNVFVADQPVWPEGYLRGEGALIRKITPTGMVSTLAGSATVQGTTDGVGSSASFNSPEGLAADSAGNVYVAELRDHSVRKITPSGVVSTMVGGGGKAGFAAGALPGSLYQPLGIAISGTTLYITMSSGVAVVTNLP